MRICPKCGEHPVMERDTRWCRECRNAYHAAWHWKHREKCVDSMRRRRQEDPERHQSYQRAYDRRHPSRRQEQMRRWQERNRGQIRHRSRERYWMNPQKAREATRRWVARNPEKVREARKRRYQSNPEKFKAQHRSWRTSRFFYERARKWENRHGYTISPLTLWGLWKRQRGRCALTGRMLDARSPRGAALDHIIARANGGEGTADNLRWVCFEANRAKDTLTDAQLHALARDIVSHASERSSLACGFDAIQHLAGVMA